MPVSGKLFIEIGFQVGEKYAVEPEMDCRIVLPVPQQSEHQVVRPYLVTSGAHRFVPGKAHD